MIAKNQFDERVKQNLIKKLEDFESHIDRCLNESYKGEKICVLFVEEKDYGLIEYLRTAYLAVGWRVSYEQIELGYNLFLE